MNLNPNWFCAQFGGREHYAVPRALHAAGALDCLMTDFWAGPVTRGVARMLPCKATRSLAAKCHGDLPDGKTDSWNLHSLAWEARLRWMTKTGGVTGRYLGFCELGKRFAHKVTRSLKARRSFPENSVFFGYDTCSLEVMEYLKERGVACVLDQIDPCRVEAEMVREEQQKWQGWEDRPLDIPEEFYERHAREWALADRVVVNSEFSRQALIQQGVHGSKIVVVPLSYELHDEMTEGEKAAFSQRKELKRFTQEKPLRVLFLGQVMLRKGIQYLAQAAELLQNLPVKFDIVGPIHISAKAVKTAPQNMFFHGRATRDTINQWYRSADVFVLPTLSDGFALTQIEAMANGLPVIATPNCGAVVSDGVDGFLVPTRDPESLAQVIRRYLEEPEILQKHFGAALQKSKQFSLHRVGTALLDLGREMY